MNQGQCNTRASSSTREGLLLAELERVRTDLHKSRTIFIEQDSLLSSMHQQFEHQVLLVQNLHRENAALRAQYHTIELVRNENKILKQLAESLQIENQLLKETILTRQSSSASSTANTRANTDGSMFCGGSSRPVSPQPFSGVAAHFLTHPQANEHQMPWPQR
jgi:hypothetical protein